MSQITVQSGMSPADMNRALAIIWGEAETCEIADFDCIAPRAIEGGVSGPESFRVAEHTCEICGYAMCSACMATPTRCPDCAAQEPADA